MNSHIFQNEKNEAVSNITTGIYKSQEINVKRMRILIILLPILLLATQGLMADDFQLRSDRPSRIVLYHPSARIVGVAATHVVIINQFLRFLLWPGEYMVIDLYPGDYLISAGGDFLGLGYSTQEWDALLLDLKEGQTQYIQTTQTWGGVKLELQKNPIDLTNMREKTEFNLLRQE